VACDRMNQECTLVSGSDCTTRNSTCTTTTTTTCNRYPGNGQGSGFAMLYPLAKRADYSLCMAKARQSRTTCYNSMLNAFPGGTGCTLQSTYACENVHCNAPQVCTPTSDWSSTCSSLNCAAGSFPRGNSLTGFRCQSREAARAVVGR